MSEARRILDRRFAAGEISETEYMRARDLLDSASTAAPDPPPLPAEALAAPKPPPLPASATLAPEPPPLLALQAARRSFILARLWRGELSLPLTYWLWGALGSACVSIAATLLLTVSSSAASTYALILIPLAWSMFMVVAIFRSANRYQRQRPRFPWGRIAQAVVCLGFVAGLGRTIAALPGNEPASALDQQLALENKQGPHMVGNNVRWERMTRTGRTFELRLTALGPSASALTPELAPVIRVAEAKRDCASPDFRRLLLSIDAMRFNYFDQQGSLLMSFDITKADCS